MLFSDFRFNENIYQYYFQFTANVVHLPNYNNIWMCKLQFQISIWIDNCVAGGAGDGGIGAIKLSHSPTHAHTHTSTDICKYKYTTNKVVLKLTKHFQKFNCKWTISLDICYEFQLCHFTPRTNIVDLT